MLTTRQYTEYLIATTGNYTCTNLADHLTGEAAVSHDTVTDFLGREKLTPRRLWDVVAPLLQDSPDSYLIVDDSVQNKQYSKQIALVKLQYSGAEHGLVRGIGVINLVHTNGQAHGFYPIDYRIYDPDGDGKSKNTHFREMLLRAISEKGLQARTILFDAWYASVDNLKLIQRLGRVFVTTLKSNRLVSLSKETGYVHLQEIDWTPDRLRDGVMVKLKELPFYVRLFKLVAPNGDIDWVITNRENDSSARPPPMSCRPSVTSVGRSRRCIANSNNSSAPKNASAARPARNATIWRAVTWPGSPCACAPVPSAPQCMRRLPPYGTTIYKMNCAIPPLQQWDARKRKSYV
jgi:hypothetical protein